MYPCSCKHTYGHLLCFLICTVNASALPHLNYRGSCSWEMRGQSEMSLRGSGRHGRVPRSPQYLVQNLPAGLHDCPLASLIIKVSSCSSATSSSSPLPLLSEMIESSEAVNPVRKPWSGSTECKQVQFRVGEPFLEAEDTQPWLFMRTLGQPTTISSALGPSSHCSYYGARGGSSQCDKDILTKCL